MHKESTPFDHIFTPALILDKERVRKNCQAMLEVAESRGVLLRPHAKTAKCAEVSRMATGGRESAITVSTLKEAEFFTRAGFTDILYAVGISPNKFPRVERIMREMGGGLTLVTDNLGVACEAVRYAQSRGLVFNFLVEVDCGESRGGLVPDDPDMLEIARVLSDAPCVNFRGVMTHAGHSYAEPDPSRVAEIAASEAAAAAHAAKAIREAGMEVEVVSVGSTPTALNARDMSGVTEMRPGVYVFHDLAQFSRGVCAMDDIALTVLATVIGHAKASPAIILDAGGLALSKDTGAFRFLPEAGYGFVHDPVTMERLGALAIHDLHQEHATVPVDDPAWFERLPVGSLVRVTPNHACMTAAAHEHYNVLENGRISRQWNRVNGW